MPRLLLCLNLLALCVACQPEYQHDDLKQFIQQEQNRPIAVQLTPVDKAPVEAVRFADAANPNPFMMFEPRLLGQQDCINRVELPALDAFGLQPLSELTFNGIIWQHGELLALITNKDNQLDFVKVGQVLGNSYGVIASIDSDGISVLEHIPQQRGCWKQVSRQLDRVSHEA